MKNDKNYMSNIYEIINAPEVEYNDDGIEYLDSPEDEYYNVYDDGLSWADDITYLDEPYEEDEFNLDLGEGYIPLHQGNNYYQEELVVIDENYVPDEFEYDIVEKYEQPSAIVEEEYKSEDQYSMENIYNIINEDDLIDLNVDTSIGESLIKFKEQDLNEELNLTDMSEEDDKIAKAIAREHMDNVKAAESVGALYGDVENIEDDTSWVDGEDLFGNDINVIIAEDPNEEVVDDNYVDGSFQDWINQQN